MLNVFVTYNENTFKPKVTDDIKKDFAKRIKQIRLSQKSSNEKEHPDPSSISGFAAMIGVNRNTVKNWEAGKTYPDMPEFLSICQKCNIEADYLLGNIKYEQRVIDDFISYSGLNLEAIRKLRRIHRNKQYQYLNMLSTVFTDKAFDSIYMSFLNLVNYYAANGQISGVREDKDVTFKKELLSADLYSDIKGLALLISTKVKFNNELRQALRAVLNVEEDQESQNPEVQ